MRAMVRYLVILSALVGLSWAAVAVPIGDRPLYGHLTHSRAATWWTGAKQYLVGLWPKGPATEPGVKPKSKRRVVEVPPKPPAIQTEKGAARRVALLNDAAKVVERSKAPRAGAKPKARIDERISSTNKKALDALVAKREARR